MAMPTSASRLIPKKDSGLSLEQCVRRLGDHHDRAGRLVADALLELRKARSQRADEVKGGEPVDDTKEVSPDCPPQAATEATQDGEQLAKLFAQMANEWRGWEGEKIWRSLDGELNLAFRHDGIGAINAKVRMRDETMVNWVVEGELALELGSLDGLAAGIKEYLRV
jgi:hypothetical protein